MKKPLALKPVPAIRATVGRPPQRLLRHGDEHVARKLKRLRLTAPRNKWWLRSRKRNEPERLAQLWEKRLVAEDATARA